VAERNERGEIRVAGGVVMTLRTQQVHVLLVHRDSFDDWALPKGKVKRGETDSAAALREVAEETGLDTELGPPLGEMHYLDYKGKAKVAHYWAMLLRGGHFQSNSEIDACEWLDIHTAAARLTRTGERDFITRVIDNIHLSQRGDRVVVEAAGYAIVFEEG
jgi:8-oxo-dGTP diphosphatase